MIRVLIADDHTLMRSGLRALLERAPDIRVIGEASDGREALALIQEHLPDVVLMDVAMTGLNGLDATRRVAREHRGARVIVLSMHKNEEYIIQALQAGASGYMLKGASVSELIVAIQSVARGEVYLCPEISRRVADYEERNGAIQMEADSGAPARDELTPRETEVLQLIAEGRTMNKIADILGISVKTVETHRYRLMDRLNIHHITGLVRYAIKTWLVQPE